eukprot:gene33151-40109_t
MRSSKVPWRVLQFGSTSSPDKNEHEDSGLSLTIPGEDESDENNAVSNTGSEMSPIFDELTSLRPNRDAATLLLDVAGQMAIIDQAAKDLAMRLDADILSFSQLPVIMASIRLRMPMVDLNLYMSKSASSRLTSSSLGNFQRYHLILADFANKKKMCLQEEKARAANLLDEYTSLPEQITWLEFMEKCLRQFILEICQDESMNVWHDHKVVTKIIEKALCVQHGLPAKDIVILAPLSYKPLGPKHRMVPLIGSSVPQASKDLILPCLGR